MGPGEQGVQRVLSEHPTPPLDRPPQQPLGLLATAEGVQRLLEAVATAQRVRMVGPEDALACLERPSVHVDGLGVARQGEQCPALSLLCLQHDGVVIAEGTCRDGGGRPGHVQRDRVGPHFVHLPDDPYGQGGRPLARRDVHQPCRVRGQQRQTRPAGRGLVPRFGQRSFQQPCRGLAESGSLSGRHPGGHTVQQHSMGANTSRAARLDQFGE